MKGKQLGKQVQTDSTLDKAANQVYHDYALHTMAFWAEWTQEVTDIRLRDWNDACISHRFGVRTTKWPVIRQFEEEVGWTYEALTKAVLGWYADVYGDAAWVLPTNARQTQVPRPKIGSKRIILGRGFNAGPQKAYKHIDAGMRQKGGREGL